MWTHIDIHRFCTDCNCGVELQNEFMPVGLQDIWMSRLLVFTFHENILVYQFVKFCSEGYTHPFSSGIASICMASDWKALCHPDEQTEFKLQMIFALENYARDN